MSEATIDRIIAQYGSPNRAEFINTRLRVNVELHAMLEQSATKNKRSFNSELCYRLALSLKEHPASSEPLRNGNSGEALKTTT